MMTQDGEVPQTRKRPANPPRDEHADPAPADRDTWEPAKVIIQPLRQHLDERDCSSWPCQRCRAPIEPATALCDTCAQDLGRKRFGEPLPRQGAPPSGGPAKPLAPPGERDDPSRTPVPGHAASSRPSSPPAPPSPSARQRPARRRGPNGTTCELLPPRISDPLLAPPPTPPQVSPPVALPRIKRRWCPGNGVRPAHEWYGDDASEGGG